MVYLAIAHAMLSSITLTNITDYSYNILPNRVQKHMQQLQKEGKHHRFCAIFKKKKHAYATFKGHVTV